MRKPHTGRSARGGGRSVEERRAITTKCAGADAAGAATAEGACPGCGRWFTGGGMRMHAASARRLLEGHRKLDEARVGGGRGGD